MYETLFQLIRPFAEWLHATKLSYIISGGWPWVWPACQTLHLMGLTLLVGCVGAFDLRMLGLAKGLAPGPLQRLLPWGVAGFCINLTTGCLFLIGDPFQYLHNAAFGFKMLFIALAGINVLLFYVTGLQRRVDEMSPGQDAPGGAKVIAAVSLLLWVGVIYWGRMLPFLGNSF